MEASALRQISHGLNNLHAAFLAHQKHTDHRFDRIDTKLDQVCDKGGLEHKGFDDRIDALERRLEAQEQRQAGRSDILVPALGWASRNWLVLVLAGAFAWQNYIQPAIARAIAPPLTIHGTL